MPARTNEEHIEGRIFQQNLELRKVENSASKNYGKEYIRGSIDVATTEDDMNVLTIHYTFVTATTNAGAENRTFSALKKIMDENKTVTTVGHDMAMKVRCTPSIALNDFYPRGSEELVSQQRNEGGFVTIISNLLPEGIDRNKFTTDILITSVGREDDDELGTKATIRGAIFNFRGDILPVQLVLRSEDSIGYFESLEPSNRNPVFTKVWGKIASSTETIKQETESAFGDPSVDIKQRRIREWVVTGAAKEPYSFGEGGILTPEQVEQAVADRNVRLADIKKRSDDYYASRNSTGNSGITGKVPEGSFQF